MKPQNRTIVISVILFFTIASDQVTKKIAQTYLAGSEIISFFYNIFRLQYIENTGGFLGMGAAVPENIRFWVFSILVALFLAALFAYLIFSKNLSRLQFYALSVILGGGIGNLIDRLLNDGKVVDFMNVGVGSLRTGIFNVADLYITFGAIFLFVLILMEGKEDKEKTSGFPGRAGK